MLKIELFQSFQVNLCYHCYDTNYVNVKLDSYSLYTVSMDVFTPMFILKLYLDILMRCLDFRDFAQRVDVGQETFILQPAMIYI